MTSRTTYNTNMQTHSTPTIPTTFKTATLAAHSSSSQHSAPAMPREALPSGDGGSIPWQSKHPAPWPCPGLDSFFDAQSPAQPHGDAARAVHASQRKVAGEEPDTPPHDGDAVQAIDTFVPVQVNIAKISRHSRKPPVLPPEAGSPHSASPFQWPTSGSPEAASDEQPAHPVGAAPPHPASGLGLLPESTWSLQVGESLPATVHRQDAFFLIIPLDGLGAWNDADARSLASIMRWTTPEGVKPRSHGRHTMIGHLSHWRGPWDLNRFFQDWAVPDREADESRISATVERFDAATKEGPLARHHLHVDVEQQKVYVENGYPDVLLVYSIQEAPLLMLARCWEAFIRPALATSTLWKAARYLCGEETNGFDVGVKVQLLALTLHLNALKAWIECPALRLKEQTGAFHLSVGKTPTFY